MDRFSVGKPKLLGPLVQMQYRAVRLQREVKFLRILRVDPDERFQPARKASVVWRTYLRSVSGHR
jgi:hypothetical protein